MLGIDDSEGVRTLTLNRPERLNTLTTALAKALHAALVDCSRGIDGRRTRLLRRL